MSESQAIRLSRGVYRAAKVCAAEAGVPLRAFCDAAVQARVAAHRRAKEKVVKVVQVEVVGRGAHGG